MGRRTGRAIRMAVVTSVVGAVSVVGACRAPTQMEVTIVVQPPLVCSDLRAITIVVGRSGPEVEDKTARGFVTTQTTCNGEGKVGTIVLTPAASSGAILVAAAFGATSQCKPPAYENCIVGRRQFAFVDHLPLKLEIGLEVSCLSVPCDALSTCRSARCRSSEVRCEEDGTCQLPEGEGSRDGGADGALGDGGGDAGEPPSDGGRPDGSDGGTSDGGTGHPGPPTNLCPQYTGPADCTLGQATDACCLVPVGFYCTGPANCTANNGKSLGCTGRLYCQQGLYCCYNGTTATCATGCAGSELLCSNDGDCPMGQTCRGIAIDVNNGQMVQKKCMP